MKENDLDKVLNYMKQYVENKYEHDSEPMLTYKDLQLVLEEIERLNKENKELKNRIGRAIYFFEKKKAEQGDIYRNCESYKTNCIDFILTDNEIKFLNILKGSDKE